MKVYSYSEARQRLAELLNCARKEGQVEIRRRDGQAFVIRPSARSGSPLDVPGVEVGLSREQIVGLVHESRQSARRFVKKITSPGKRVPRPTRRRQVDAGAR